MIDEENFWKVLGGVVFFYAFIACGSGVSVLSTFPDKTELVQRINDIANTIPAFVALLVTHLLVGWVGFAIRGKLDNQDHIREEARLMIFTKNAAKMDKDALLAVVLKHGGDSRDGVIAITELQSRKDLFNETADAERLALDDSPTHDPIQREGY